VRAGNVLGCQSSYLEARGVSGRTLGILMDSHGGREELAPYPDWAARYLVHKNATQKAYVLAHGDLSGSWPIHVREAENCQWTNPYLP